MRFAASVLVAVSIWLEPLRLAAAEKSAPWPQFRGPGAGGMANDAKPPVHFGPQTNLLWRIGVPAGHSSPIVVDGRIVFNAAEGRKLLTCAVDQKTGRSLWQGAVDVDQLEKFHDVNTATPCTPTTDGQRVISYLPSFGVVAYDLDGRERWRKRMPLPQSYRSQGSGASPLLAGGLVIVELPLEHEVDIIALRASDGSEAWKAPQPLRQMGWGTPVAWKEADAERFGVVFGGQFAAYQLTDGKEIWSVKGLGAEACATPVVVDDRILLSTAGVQGEPANMTIPPEFKEALKLWDKNGDGKIVRDEISPDYLLTDRKTSGGKGNMTLRQMMGWFQREESDRGYNAESWEKLREMLGSFRDGELNRASLVLVRGGGQGDVSKTRIIWQNTKAVPEIPSPLVYRDRVYLVRNGGLLACRALESGKLIFDERIGAPGGYFASPIAADGRIYLASDAGMITVVEATEELKVLARNKLEEGVFASPAAAGRALYIRSTGHLWAFQE